MKRRMLGLAQRRHLLLKKIEAQRSELAQLSEQCQRPLAWVDTGLSAVRYLRAHPAVLAGGVATVLSLRHKGLFGLAKTGWRLIYLYPSILSFAWQAVTSRRVVAKRDPRIDLGA
jgi:hypothetical protein